MPRPRRMRTPETLDPEDLRPLVGQDGPTFATAMFAIGTWGASTRFREQLMEISAFPLPEDVAAFLVVNQLIYRGVARPTDLADAIDTGRSNISKIVTRLESHGLVTRIADPFDKRAVAVALTPAGRTVARRVVAATSSLHVPDHAEWTNEDAAELERLLVKLVQALDAMPQHPLSTISGVNLSGRG